MFYFFISIFLFCNIHYIFADTVYLKNGKIYHGKVIEIYTDRIVLKEISGEINIQQSNIKKIVYDDEEKNLLAIGNKYFKKDRFQEALNYYEKALKINPKSNQVKEAILRVRSLLFRKRDNLQKKRLNQRRNIRMWSETKRKHYVQPRDIEKDTSGYVEQELGIVIDKKDKLYHISDVLPQSPAEKLHLFRGDVVFSINGRSIKNLSVQEVYNMLANKQKKHIVFTIERKIVILRGKKRFYQTPWSRINAKVKKADKGFHVISVQYDGRSYLAGLRIKDIIINVEGEPASFMSMKSFEKKLKGKEGSRLVLYIHRQLKIKKKLK